MKRKRDDSSENRQNVKKRKIEQFPQTLNTDIYCYYKGLRIPKPYFYEYRANAKKRWIGREVLEIYVDEFVGYPPQYWKDAVESGRITVNGNKVATDHKLKQHDKIVHRFHRHEFPILDTPIKFLKVTDDFLFLEKPASIPVHPCGKYNYNSLTMILQHEYGFKKDELFLVHRIDRLTSGVLIVARSRENARRKYHEIVGKRVSKFYLAKVKGKFSPLRQVVKLAKNMASIDKRRGRWGIVENGTHPSLSYFFGLSYDSETNTSLVLVKIITGRTHQIRIHCAYLGHEVVGDPLYGSGGKEVPFFSTEFDSEIKKEPKCFDCEGGQPLYHPHDLQVCLHSWKYRNCGGEAISVPFSRKKRRRRKKKKKKKKKRKNLPEGEIEEEEEEEEIEEKPKPVTIMTEAFEITAGLPNWMDCFRNEVDVNRLEGWVDILEKQIEQLTQKEQEKGQKKEEEKDK